MAEKCDVCKSKEPNPCCPECGGEEYYKTMKKWVIEDMNHIVKYTKDKYNKKIELKKVGDIEIYSNETCIVGLIFDKLVTKKILEIEYVDKERSCDPLKNFPEPSKLVVKLNNKYYFNITYLKDLYDGFCDTLGEYCGSLDVSSTLKLAHIGDKDNWVLAVDVSVSFENDYTATTEGVFIFGGTIPDEDDLKG